MIRLPQRHIADSVTERLLQLARQLGSQDKVAAQGAALDQALQQPIADIAPLAGIEDAIAAKALDL